MDTTARLGRVMKIATGLIAGTLLIASTAQADAVEVLREFEGYTVIAVMTVTGWRDPNGKEGDSFEGCEFDRIIIFDGSKALACATYSYSYAYRPQAAILVRGSSFKMVIGDEAYDMRPVR